VIINVCQAKSRKYQTVAEIELELGREIWFVEMVVGYTAQDGGCVIVTAG
jgi:hypothetical protein